MSVVPQYFFSPILLLILLDSCDIETGKVTPGFHSDDVPLYGAFELMVRNHKDYDNKFDYAEIELQAVFRSPSSVLVENVYGFYDGDGTGGQEGDVWRLRFMPTEPGEWSYTYTWTDGSTGGKGSFTCLTSKHKGPLQIDQENPYYFRTMNGEVFHAKAYDLHQVGPMGSVLGPSRQPGPRYRGTDWSDDMDDVHRAVMDDYMVPNGYNLTMLGSANHEDYPPTYWVDQDTSRFNIPVWKVTENIYLHARERGIYCFQFDGLVRIKPVKTIPTLHRWNRQLIRYYCARLSSISSHTGFNPTRENYKLPSRGYSKGKMNELMRFCKASIPRNYKALLTIHDNMYKEFADWQDFAIRQHPSKHVGGNSKDSQQGNNNDRGVDIDDFYEPYNFPVIGAEDVWEGLTQKGVAECIRPIWGQIMAGIIPMYSEWNRWIEVQGTGVAEELYRKGLEWWYEKVDYRHRGWRKMNDLVFGDDPNIIASGIPGVEYLAYREGNSPLTIDLSNAKGGYAVSFFNPFTGDRYDDVSEVSGGALLTIKPPYPGDDVVLLLKSIGEQ